MREFIPRVASDWTLEEPQAMRRFSRSVLETAILTGVALRALRALVLSAGIGDSWVRIVLFAVVAMLILFGVATLHLGNYPVKRWLWRAPAFAGLVVVAEMTVSALLISVGREYIGSSVATWGDWPAMLRSAMLTRIPAVCLYSGLLAGTVQLVRRVAARSS
ncbi:MAG TPA: hypothetical protein VKZ41_14310 [Gemmatimonadales bacterium]|nr:hypothetical protein [Gemmatimonadales bacterium]